MASRPSAFSLPSYVLFDVSNYFELFHVSSWDLSLNIIRDISTFDSFWSSSDVTCWKLFCSFNRARLWIAWSILGCSFQATPGGLAAGARPPVLCFFSLRLASGCLLRCVAGWGCLELFKWSFARESADPDGEPLSVALKLLKQFRRAGCFWLFPVFCKKARSVCSSLSIWYLWLPSQRGPLTDSPSFNVL